MGIKVRELSFGAKPGRTPIFKRSTVRLQRSLYVCVCWAWCYLKVCTSHSERGESRTLIFPERNSVSQRNLGHHKYTPTDASILNTHKTAITGKAVLNQIPQETQQLQMSKMTLHSLFCMFAIGYAVALFFLQSIKRLVIQGDCLPT